MIAPDLETGIRHLRELVEEAAVVVPFTGAGISTECGIPDFRSPGGIWTKMRPIDFGDFLASQEMRDESWRRRFAMQEQFGGAKPGRGHRALASLYKAGKIPGVITQNIDNLHQDSGIAADHVVELHGNTTYATCLDCAKRYGIVVGQKAVSTIRADVLRNAAIGAAASSRPRPCRSASRCPRPPCGAPRKLTESCDLFLAIGSSLVVWPAAGFPAGRQTQRRAARDHQSGRDGVRRNRRSRAARRHRRDARAVHCALTAERISTRFSQAPIHSVAHAVPLPVRLLARC